MANTVIQLKFSTTTATPPSLNIAEPAYSYVSNTLFIGAPTGQGVIPIGGKFYLDQQQVIYDQSNTSYNYSNSAFNTANIAYSLAGNALTSASYAFAAANSAFISANNKIESLIIREPFYSKAADIQLTANSFIGNTNISVSVINSGQQVGTFLQSDDHISFNYTDTIFTVVSVSDPTAETSTVVLNKAIDANLYSANTIIYGIVDNNYGRFTELVVDGGLQFTIGNGPTANTVVLQTNDIVATGAFRQANAAFDTANAAFASANTTTTQIQPAFNTANAAFDAANSAAIAANTPSYTANSSGVYANAAFIWANAAYNQANTNKANLVNNGYAVELFANGSLSLPSSLIINNDIRSKPGNYLVIYSDTSTEVSWQGPYGTEIPVYSGITSDSSQGTKISSAKTDSVGNYDYKNWSFGYDGKIQFPDNTLQNTAFQGYGIDNVARYTANSAAIAANTPSHVANSTAIAANTPSHVANSSSVYANAAFEIANSAAIAANTPSSVANNAWNAANAAFIRANNSLDANNGGLVQGNVIFASNVVVQGNLTVLGSAEIGRAHV